MKPVLWKDPFFGFELRSFAILLMIAFFAAIFYAQKRAPKFGLTKENVVDASFWAIILGVLGARLLFIAQDPGPYFENPRLLFSKFEGLTSFGGILGGILGLWIWSKKSGKPFVTILDVGAAPFLLAHAIGRVGCLLNGCCYGGECHLPWGIHVDGLPGLYHPAQIYDSLMTLAGLALLVFVERRGVRYGQSVALALVIYGVSRFIYEFWRMGTTSSTVLPVVPITDAQAVALVLVLAGLLIGWFTRRRGLLSKETVAT